jgi:hypothetical protein
MGTKIAMLQSLLKKIWRFFQKVAYSKYEDMSYFRQITTGKIPR